MFTLFAEKSARRVFLCIENKNREILFMKKGNKNRL